MKINLVKVVSKSRWRCGVALLACLFLISCALMQGVAQSKNQKRVTSLQIGEAAEGSRVTVVSDSALNDYEAFRRGDRFYVKIPLAEFTSAQPHFRGDGFDDVQAQKVGDSVVVSFKLQPGASAHVDQRSNRLDVIFSAPNRMARSNTVNRVSNRAAPSVTGGSRQVASLPARPDRGRDVVGPVPPGSPQPYRERGSTERPSENRTTQSQRAQVNARSDSNKLGNSPFATSTTAAPKSQSPATVGSPSTSAGYPALAGSTPAPLASAKAAATPSGLSASPSWNSRTQQALRWASANRLATLLGALLLLSLMLFIAAVLYRRRKSVVKANREKAPLAQPKYSPRVELNEVEAPAPVNSPVLREVSKQFVTDYAKRPQQSELTASPVVAGAANASRTSSIQEELERIRLAQERAIIASIGAAAPQNHARVLTKPTIDSDAAGDNKSSTEDKEREVFEL